MKIKESTHILSIMVFSLVALITTVSCCYSAEGAKEGSRAQSRSVTNGLDNPFVFIALINDDDALKVSGLVVTMLRRRGIESSIEGGTAGLSISVRKPNVEKAVRAIAAAPELKWKGIAIREKFLYLINGTPPTKPVPEPFVVIARIKDGASEEFVKAIHIELLKRGIASTIESAGAGFRISVSQREVEKAVKAIAVPPDLREQGISINEEYLHPFEQMTANCMSVIANRASSDEDLLEAISRLGRMSEPPAFWTAIIQNPAYSMLHRKRCVMALFRRHGSYQGHAADLANVLDATKWLHSGDITQVGAITGSIPVDVNLDDTIFLIMVLDRAENESGEERKSKRFGIYLRVVGKVTLEDFTSVVRTGRPSTGDGNVLIVQYGYADDYDEWLRRPEDRPTKTKRETPEGSRR
jgi:hypothetical protein